jgi:hypothetical protein
MLRNGRRRRQAHDRGDHSECVSELCEVAYERGGRRGLFRGYPKAAAKGGQ